MTADAGESNPSTAGRQHSSGGISLVDECGSCAALCCVGLALSRSADFAIDKPAGVPCRHLAEDLTCAIHDELAARGFPGCVTYTCFGAGPRVTAAFAPDDWRSDPVVGQQMFAALGRLRLLHELLWYVRAALAHPLPGAVRESLERAEAATHRLAQHRPAELPALDLPGHRGEVNATLRLASSALRSPDPGPDLSGRDLTGAARAAVDLRRASLRGARLVGADLRRADLRGADFTGADLRGADLRGADLRAALFLTPAQIRSARVDCTTRLPERLPSG